MILRKRNIAFLLLIIIIVIITERSVPHSHEDHNGIVIIEFPDHKTESDKNTNQHEIEEKLHSSSYQLSVCDYSFVQYIEKLVKWQDDCVTVKIKKEKTRDYNILTKIVKSLLFIVHTSSSKSPPSCN
jgi:hypothetical protein